MKFKVGDKVRTKYGDGHEGTIIKVDSLANYPYFVKIDTGYCAGLKCYLQEDHLELVKTDLRDLLKVGYMYTTTDYQYLVGNLDVLHAKERRDKNLKGLGIWKDIIAIHKPKYNGVKPMEWELVWERKEPKYYLRSWVDSGGHVVDNVLGDELNYLNFDTNSKTLFLLDHENFRLTKTQFTQKEIDNLPNQEFIKTLVKEEVK